MTLVSCGLCSSRAVGGRKAVKAKEQVCGWGLVVVSNDEKTSTGSRMARSRRRWEHVGFVGCLFQIEVVSPVGF